MFLSLWRYRGQSHAPPLIAFFALEQDWIEEKSPIRFDWLHRHDIHHPIHPFELEVQAIAKERVGTGRKTQTRLEFRIGTDGL